MGQVGLLSVGQRCIRAYVLKIRSCRMQYVGNLDRISYFDDHGWRGSSVEIWILLCKLLVLSLSRNENLLMPTLNTRPQSYLTDGSVQVKN